MRLARRGGQEARATLNHPELHPPRFADHVLIPWRVPNELDVCFIHAVDTKNFALRIMRGATRPTGKSAGLFDDLTHRN
jgi:hypothetical protein